MLNLVFFVFHEIENRFALVFGGGIAREFDLKDCGALSLRTRDKGIPSAVWLADREQLGSRKFCQDQGLAELLKSFVAKIFEVVHR